MRISCGGSKSATGLPILVNTSFNVHEEPIINQPAECLRALRDGRVDFVVTEQFVIRYKPPLKCRGNAALRRF